jgi:ribonucleoside-diphosphate reductase alpha chain
MDCDTTGIEPEFSLVKTKKLAGGGQVHIVNQGISMALAKLGYSVKQREVILKQMLAGRDTNEIDGLEAQHRSIFACAMGSGGLSSEAHLGMMAAVQPFVSGAISKTVNLPQTVSVADVENVFWKAWKMGLKSISIYRDGSKRSQPLNAKSSSGMDRKSWVPVGFQKCPECGGVTELHSGCYRCVNCGFTLGCA